MDEPDTLTDADLPLLPVETFTRLAEAGYCLLLADQEQAARMGQAAHAHVREQYVGDLHLLRYARLLPQSNRRRLTRRSPPVGGRSPRHH